MFAGVDGLQAQRNMVLVGDCHDDGFDLWVGQHLVVVAVGNLRLPGGFHFSAKVVGDVTDGVEFDIACLGARVEVSHLRDRTAAENSDSQLAVVTHGFPLVSTAWAQVGG